MFYNLIFDIMKLNEIGEAMRIVDRLLKVYSENRRICYAYVFRFMGNREDTEDVMQTAYYRACRTDYSKIPIEKLLCWLLVICRNECFRELKKRGRECSLEVMAPYLEELRYEEDMLEFFYIETAQASLLKVDERLRAPIKEILLEGAPIRAAARKYDVPESSVRYSMKKVKKDLKKIFVGSLRD